LELPFGAIENSAGVDSAANQGKWAETMVYPAVFLTDPRVGWEAVDDGTARVYVPFGESEQFYLFNLQPPVQGVEELPLLQPGGE
jgi:hypothetical protein